MYKENSLFRKLLKHCAMLLIVIFTFTSVVQADTAAGLGQRSSAPQAALVPKPTVESTPLDLFADCFRLACRLVCAFAG